MEKDDIEIINLVPNFLKYYTIAKKTNNCDHFPLWKKHYNFAAVPPGEKGEQLAEQMLKEAWNKYDQIIPALNEWLPNSKNLLKHLLSIKQALGYNKRLEFVVVFFVGFFEDNAFVTPHSDNKVAICFPVETQINDVSFVHELTHLVHSKTANFKTQWERSVASIVITEGLATQLSKCLVPGYQDELYIEFQKNDWLQECRRNETQILKGILPDLKEKDSETVFKYTMSTGTTGIEREAYYVGWRVIECMLEEGWSFFEIGQIQEQEFEKIAQKYIKIILNPKKS